jgi:hypothetical protein
LHSITASYVALADSPAALFLSELIELYPDATVICSMRDNEAWVKSVRALM